MKLNVLFFGSLAEYAGTYSIEVSDKKTLSELQKWLQDQYPVFKEFTYITAVNQKIQKEDTTLHDGDEIALMPPFAGG